MKELDKVFQEFQENTNISLSEARKWKDTEASKKASLSREPINDFIRLKETPKDQWSDQDDGFNEVEEAEQVNSFVSRMRGVEDGEEVDNTGMSKRDISLINWGYLPEDEENDFERLI